MLDSTVAWRSRNAAASRSGLSSAAWPRWRNTLRIGIRPFLMSWFTWRARSPIARRRSASRKRAAPARSRSVMAPSRRLSVPISSDRSLSNATSSRSMSTSAVFAESAVSGRLIRGEGEERRFRGARLHQRGARRSRREEAWQRGVGPIVLIAEMPGAHDAARLVLDLQQREPGELHGVTGVVEQMCTLAPLQRRAEQVVSGDGVPQGGEPERDPRALPVQVRADHRYERGHALLVFRRQAVRHHRANP